MHWGTYSQWGIVESWSLCSEDLEFIKRTNGHYQDYAQYKKDYENLKKTFNPTEFNPERWVEAAKDAGMKYVVFTTKHHDGFSMFDTQQTDYKITSRECPFHTHPKADVTKAIFNTFRNEGFMIGAYYSKPDWHTEYYWWPYFATPNRHVNYDPAKYPERWDNFKNFTYHQVEELMSGYGNIDILWLDGGWVRPSIKNQDIEIPRIAAMARNHQPGLLVVDRTVGGPYENYLTPEQTVPEQAMELPWESCITMGESWSYTPGDNYKPAHQLVHMLVDIVSKGGNFLLNIGPSPKGDFDPVAYDRLKELGNWMDTNGEAIYATRPVAPFKEGKVRLTQRKNDNTLFAIYLAEENEYVLPAKIRLSTIQPSQDAHISLLGDNSLLEFERTSNGFVVTVPEKLRKNPPGKYAWTLKISEKK